MAREPRIGAMAALALCLPLAAPALSQTPTPPDGIVWLALRDINDARVDREDPTNHPPLAREPPPGMIRAVDVTPDGRTDWLVDYEAAGVARYCGTGGCLTRLYVSHGDGYVRAFDAQALELVVTRTEGEPRIEARVHPLYCAPVEAGCRYSYAWDAAAGRLVARGGPAEPATGAHAFVPLRPPEE